MARPSVVVVGSSNTDMVVKSQRIPGPGETVTGGQFVMAPGGKGANQAVAAARLGAEVTLVARLGSDMFGDEAVAGYEKEGIRTDLIVRDPEQATGVALILVDAQGENSISVASGANHALSPVDVERAAERIAAASVLMLQLETPLEAALTAASIAAEAGVAVILDPAPAPDGPLPGELLRKVTYLTPNESEAQRLCGCAVSDETSAHEAAETLRELGPQHVILTRGARGVVVAGPEGCRSVPAPKVEAQDSTAAGDAFNGALACALAAGASLEEAAGMASRVGALSTTKMGAQPSLPTQAELEGFAG